MILSFISKKGGVSKTTSAVHVASHLARRGPTLLIDGDDTRSATLWASGGHLPFTVLGESEAGNRSSDFEHVVIDTEGGLGDLDIVNLARQSDLVILPTPPSTLSLSAVLETVDVLRRSGNGTLISFVHKTGPSHIDPGKPWQNGIAESFHSRSRDELLNVEVFSSPSRAQVLINAWRAFYNSIRPHSSLGYRTPHEFAALHAETQAATTAVHSP